MKGGVSVWQSIRQLPYPSPVRCAVKKYPYFISLCNSAARLLTYTKRSAHITPILFDLHWLPVSSRITYKILLLTFKSLNGLAPSYLSDLLSLYIPPRHLRTSGCELFCEPRFRLSSMGGRSFSVIAPKLWNSLPLALRTTTTLHEFKSELKTHLFTKYYLS